MPASSSTDYRCDRCSSHLSEDRWKCRQGQHYNREERVEKYACRTADSKPSSWTCSPCAADKADCTYGRAVTIRKGKAPAEVSKKRRVEEGDEVEDTIRAVGGQKNVNHVTQTAAEMIASNGSSTQPHLANLNSRTHALGETDISTRPNQPHGPMIGMGNSGPSNFQPAPSHQSRSFDGPFWTPDQILAATYGSLATRNEQADQLAAMTSLPTLTWNRPTMNPVVSGFAPDEISNHLLPPGDHSLGNGQDTFYSQDIDNLSGMDLALNSMVFGEPTGSSIQPLPGDLSNDSASSRPNADLPMFTSQGDFPSDIPMPGLGLEQEQISFVKRFRAIKESHKDADEATMGKAVYSLALDLVEQRERASQTARGAQSRMTSGHKGQTPSRVTVQPSTPIIPYLRHHLRYFKYFWSGWTLHMLFSVLADHTPEKSMTLLIYGDIRRKVAPTLAPLDEVYPSLFTGNKGEEFALALWAFGEDIHDVLDQNGKTDESAWVRLGQVVAARQIPYTWLVQAMTGESSEEAKAAEMKIRIENDYATSVLKRLPLVIDIERFFDKVDIEDFRSGGEEDVKKAFWWLADSGLMERA